MRSKFIEHILSICFIGLIFFGLLYVIKSSAKDERTKQSERISPFLKLEFLDLDSPSDRTLLLETLNTFYPENKDYNQQIISELIQYRNNKLTTSLQSSRESRTLNGKVFSDLLFKYLTFIFVYLIVFFVTHYGVQTMAVYRFISKKNPEENLIPSDWKKRGLFILRKIGKGFFYLILFSPGYVIAYSFKTKVDTDSILFMILLGAISNGLLITYANKFYTFLITESRKGYVQTAIVKNLNADYSKKSISLKMILHPIKRFPDHIFRHIYVNAKFQYFSTIKEQASFLITGLIIIEMALNIQGHLCYELLQNILYKNYDIVITILFGIYLLVKATEMIIDFRQHKATLYYSNAE